MDGILTFILVTILVFYLLGAIGRALLNGWIRRRQQEFSRGNGNPFSRRGTGGRQEKPLRPEGEMTIERTRPAEKKVSRNVGDYVDYEEVAEENTATREK